MAGRKKLAIFDMDGTLLDTLGDLAAACNHALRTQGCPEHPREAYRYFVGDGVYKLIARCAPESLRDDANALARLKADFDAYYGAHSDDLTRPYDGIIPLLDRMLAQGMTLAVLSNKPHAFVETLAPQYFGDRFAVVHGQRDGFPRKPDASLVREILALTGVDAADCIYLGDSGVDMRTAKNGGVLAVGVLWGFRDREELLEGGADLLAACPEEILDFCQNRS